MASTAILAVRMMGKCANGAEADGGRLYHAKLVGPQGSFKAICGAAPGRRSAGWSDFLDSMKPVEKTTCPRCRSKFKREAERLGAIGLIDAADDLRLALRSERN